MISLARGFAGNDEAAWLGAVDKALKGRRLETLDRRTSDGIAIRALYREEDFASSADPLGIPGQAPFLRAPSAAPDRWLPWDIRQLFFHPDAATTHAEILRDLERGVSSVEILLGAGADTGVRIDGVEDFATLLAGVRADIATIALSHADSCGTRASLRLADWAASQGEPAALKLDFNIDPLGALMRTGGLEGGLDAAMQRTSQALDHLASRFSLAGLVRIDACPVHEAGGSEAQELGALIACAIDTLRRLGSAPAPERMRFCIALDTNYGLGIAKLRAARRLWARCLEAMGLPATAMRLQAVTSARMLTRYDPWTNILRVTAAVFAGATGGADIITARAFNEALGCPEELGRRIARNTQIIAMEESQLGRVADPTGGAWFTERLADELAGAAWQVFQEIEKEGGFAASLLSGAFQARVAGVREARKAEIARRRIPLTGVSEYPMEEEIGAPIALLPPGSGSGGGGNGLSQARPAILCEPLIPIRLAADFERLRAYAESSGTRPRAFLATLGSLAEFTPRADFSRNLLAAGGLGTAQADADDDPVAAFRASGCRLAIICGTDKAYETGAAALADALRSAGAEEVWLAGRLESARVDFQIFTGCDVLLALQRAHQVTGVHA